MLNYEIAFNGASENLLVHLTSSAGVHSRTWLAYWVSQRHSITFVAAFAQAFQQAGTGAGMRPGMGGRR